MRIFITTFIMAAVLSACQKNADNLDTLDLSSNAAPPETMSIIIKNYKPQSGNNFQNIFVSNYSIKAAHGELAWSSARDGLSDVLKQATVSTYNFAITSSESAVTGFADLLLYNAGINVTSYPQLSCASDDMGSSTNDMIIYNDARYGGSPTQVLGFRDCEKSYLGLDPNKFDYNNSGIPDYLQVRCGMNPLNPSEAYASTAGDGVANIDKCKMNIPLDESANTEANQLFAYQYSQSLNTDGSMNFTINNIPILQEGANNFIAFYVTEINQNTSVTSLYTAYAIIKTGYTGKTLQFDYWATSAPNFFNAQVVVPDITTP